MNIRTLALTVAALAAGSLGAHAQQAISFCGGDIMGPGNSSWSYTCGEVAVQRAEDRAITVVNVTQYFTEGVQQAFFSRELGITTPLLVEVSIYPNPTDRGVVIKCDESASGLIYEVFDLAGQSVATGTYEGGAQYLDMSQYATGSYMFRISTVDKKRSNIYKIIKTN